MVVNTKAEGSLANSPEEDLDFVLDLTLKDLRLDLFLFIWDGNWNLNHDLRTEPDQTLSEWSREMIRTRVVMVSNKTGTRHESCHEGLGLVFDGLRLELNSVCLKDTSLVLKDLRLNETSSGCYCCGCVQSSLTEGAINSRVSAGRLTSTNAGLMESRWLTSSESTERGAASSHSR